MVSDCSCRVHRVDGLAPSWATHPLVRRRCQVLIAMMPPHSVYVETHLGGGATMRRKPAALHNIGIELDAHALASFRCGYDVALVHGCAQRFLETLTDRSWSTATRRICG